MDQDKTIEKPCPPSPDKYNAKWTPISDVIALFEDNPNLTYKQVGKLLGITKSAVIGLCQRHGYKPETAKRFKKHLPAVFRAKAGMIVNTMTEEDAKKVTIDKRGLTAGILLTKADEAEGKAGAVIEIRDMRDGYQNQVNQGKAVLKALLNRLKDLGPGKEPQDSPQVVDAEIIDQDPNM